MHSRHLGHSVSSTQSLFHPLSLLQVVNVFVYFICYFVPVIWTNVLATEFIDLLLVAISHVIWTQPIWVKSTRVMYFMRTMILYELWSDFGLVPRLFDVAVLLCRRVYWSIRYDNNIVCVDQGVRFVLRECSIVRETFCLQLWFEGLDFSYTAKIVGGCFWWTCFFRSAAEQI